MPARPGDRYDRYVIEELLGAGGMGEVYRARDEKLRRMVALKIVRGEETFGGTPPAEGAARLAREARAAAALDHPNAVAIFDIGERDGAAYFAMELVEGRTLRAYVGDSSIPIADRVRWLADVARALSTAHHRGLVHRDVKPENVMIRHDGAVKVLDFGIARRAHATTTAATLEADAITGEGTMIGTPAYMAPEQLRGEQVDPRADQFAWGVTAYELLAGKSPWASQGGAAHVVAAILSHTPPALASIDETIPAAVSDAVARAMAKNAGDRFASMDDVIAALGVANASAPRPMARVRSQAPVMTPDALTATQFAPAAGRARARTRFALLFGAGGIGAAAVALSLLPRLGAKRNETPPPRQTSSSPSPPPPARSLVEKRLTAFSADREVSALSVDATGQHFTYVDDDGLWLSSRVDSTRRRIELSKWLGALAEKSTLVEQQIFPDGKRLLVTVRLKDAKDKSGGRSTWIVPLDGAAATRARDGLAFAIAPDGARVAFVRGGQIVVGPIEGGPTSTITSLADDEWTGIEWSPDGSAIAYVRSSGGAAEPRIEVAAADGSWTRAVVVDRPIANTSSPNPTWTASNKIAYPEIADDETVALLELTLDERHGAAGTRRLWVEPLTMFTSLQYRGDSFFFIRSDSQRDVYRGRMNAAHTRLEGELSRVTTSDANDSLNGFLPDGRVLFSSLREGKARIYAQALDSKTPVALSPDGVEASAVGLIANGEIVAVRRENDAAIVSAFRPGAPLRDLFTVRGGMLRVGRPEFCARCSSTAPPRCVVSEGDKAEPVYVMFDPITGTRAPPIERLGASSGLYCNLSPDGATLYLPDNDKIRFVDTATGAVRTVTVGGRVIQWLSPLPERDSYLVSGLGMFDKWFGFGRVDASSHASPLWSSDVLWTYSPMLAPNGRDFAVVVRAFDSDVWRLEPMDAK